MQTIAAKFTEENIANQTKILRGETKMVKVICDRCGKDITGKPKQQITTNYIGSNENRCYGVPLEEDKHSERELCVDCYSDFKEFMRL